MLPIDFFYRASQQYSDRVAVESPAGSLSYTELREQVSSMACVLQAMDPEPESRVGLCAGNAPEYIIAMLAIMAAGKTWVPLNYRSTVPEIGRILDTIQPSIVISDEQGEKLTPDFSGHRVRFSEINTLVASHAGRVPVRHERAPDAVQAIKFTGGTTGLPKGVMQPCRAWTAAIINQVVGWRITETDCFVVCAPISHGTGTYVLPLLAQGGRLLLSSSTAAEDLIHAFSRCGGTMTFMPPTLIYKLMAVSGTTSGDFPALRLLIYGGAPMPEEKIEQAQAFFGPILATTYGQTEAPQIATLLPPEALANPAYRASVGQVTWFTEIAIVSPCGERQPPGGIGEVAIRGDLVMNGYWKLPEKTAETIRDGWLYTGDAGYLDAQGYLFLKERLRDVIITGGFNVYPLDVENVLSQHPAVHEACVFGLPDDKWGESVNAVVELKTGHTANAEALRQFVKDRLGSVLTPKQLHLRDSLPRSAVGKVLKTAIRDQYLPSAHAAGSLTTEDQGLKT